MRQLVQLKRKAADFKKLKAEVVFVFREERGEAKGIAAIQKKRQTKFKFVSDLGAQKTRPYSRKKGQFATYILDKKGTVREILDGTKAKRPGPDPMLKVLKALQAGRTGAKPNTPPKAKVPAKVGG